MTPICFSIPIKSTFHISSKFYKREITPSKVKLFLLAEILVLSLSFISFLSSIYFLHSFYYSPFHVDYTLFSFHSPLLTPSFFSTFFCKSISFFSLHFLCNSIFFFFILLLELKLFFISRFFAT